MCTRRWLLPLLQLLPPSLRQQPLQQVTSCFPCLTYILMQLCNTILILSVYIAIIISWNIQDQRDNRFIQLLEQKLTVASLATLLSTHTEYTVVIQ